MSPGLWGLLTGVALGSVGTLWALACIRSYPREDERARMLERELGIGSDAHPDVWRR